MAVKCSRTCSLRSGQIAAVQSTREPNDQTLDEQMLEVSGHVRVSRLTAVMQLHKDSKLPQSFHAVVAL